MKIATQLLAALITPGLCIAQSSSSGSQRNHTNYVLQCKGVTTTTTSLKEDGPQAITQKSTDELRIVRHDGLLDVQVNIARYRSMNERTKKFMDKPDSYRIVAETTGEGFIATSNKGSIMPLFRVLTIDRSLTYGTWTESGFTLLLEPQSEPTSTTVSLACTKE
jgi:hypothetical protein